MNFIDYCIANKDFSSLNAINVYTRLYADTECCDKTDESKKKKSKVTIDKDKLMDDISKGLAGKIAEIGEESDDNTSDE